MRTLAVALLLATVQSAAAQAPELHRAGLPRHDVVRLEAMIQDSATQRITGDYVVGSGERVDGNLYVRRGILRIAGTVRGQVLVVDGDLDFEPGAEVTGDVTVVGGVVTGSDDARLAGTVTEYGEGFGLLARAERLHDGRDDWRGGTRNAWRDRDCCRDRAEAGLSVGVGQNYNRVEGLPVQIGPTFSTGGENPMRIEGRAIWRTDVGPLTQTERMGYLARAEQFFGGGAVRIGGTYSSTIQPIESWTATDLESSLASAILHEDLRDYYESEGWSAYLRVAPRRSPLDIVARYREERHSSVAVRNPWTLFDQEEPWRDQPLVGEGRVRLAELSLQWDSRRGSDFVPRGWFARVDVLRGLSGTLAMPQAGLFPAGATTTFDSDFTTAMLDLRTYVPFDRIGSIGFRVLGGGSVDDRTVAPQFQHALGGAGTLPGYSLMSVDCGARGSSVAVPANGTAAPTRFFTGYGCDRFALFQAEYRGGLDLHFGDRGSHWRHVDTDVDWTIFFDAARGWVLGNEVFRADTETLYDAGAGIVLGGFGIYGAVPLSGEERPLRVFIRLGPRF
jgi:hypothetical protein